MRPGRAGSDFHPGRGVGSVSSPRPASVLWEWLALSVPSTSCAPSSFHLAVSSFSEAHPAVFWFLPCLPGSSCHPRMSPCLLNSSLSWPLPFCPKSDTATALNCISVSFQLSSSSSCLVLPTPRSVCNAAAPFFPLTLALASWLPSSAWPARTLGDPRSHQSIWGTILRVLTFLDSSVALGPVGHLLFSERRSPTPSGFLQLHAFVATPENGPHFLIGYVEEVG